MYHISSKIMYLLNFADFITSNFTISISLNIIVYFPGIDLLNITEYYCILKSTDNHYIISKVHCILQPRC